ncbi:MAG: peptidoglycan-binding protein [Pseudomonadota bacterium]
MRTSSFLVALFAGLFALFAVGPAPERALTLQLGVESAEARPGGRGGGFKGRAHMRPKGARSRPANRARPRPGSRPRPSTRPNRPRPSTRPVAGTRPGAGNRPGNRPGAGNRPGNRPGAGNRPGNRPGAGNRPGNRPGARPPGNRPGARPPGNRPGNRPGYRPGRPRPPGYRPPGYRPPHWRPPAWRPPAYRPPFARPPHWRWGSYYYYPRWGWYFTAALASSTLVYVATLPREKECEQIRSEGETMYVCDGVLYRSTVYQDEQVFEIVSEPEEVIDAGDAGGVSESYAAQGSVLQLTSPRMRGDDVLALQRELSARGYPVGAPDGVFGPATDRALRAFQEDNELAPSGVLTEQTAAALGF